MSLPSNILHKRLISNGARFIAHQGKFIDIFLLLAIIMCALTGFVVLYSASDARIHPVIIQGLSFSAGLVIMLVIARIPPQRFYKLATTIYLTSLILLILVLIAGHIGMGAQRWLSFGPLHFQPSEFMKLAMPLMLARWFDQRNTPPSASALIFGLILIAVPFILILIEPDLGTSVLVAASGGFIILLAGVRLRWLCASIITLLITSPVLWHFMHGYQKDRILTFLNPARDPLGKGYHIIQSEIAVGAGGGIGKGFMQGTQSHLQFLPTHTTDFIFCVLSEEWGFVGGLIILCLYGLIAFRCFKISMNGQFHFERLLAGGLGCTFTFSALVNIAMVIGLVPVVGVPLPLISYGGSSMLAFMVGFGIIMSIGTHRKLLPS